MNELFEGYITPMACNVSLFITSSNLNKHRYESLIMGYSILDEAFERYKRETYPNNKLKMLGIPMRRKRRKH